ncbi:MAG TPA: hypothetical protein V6D17_10905 [Candidatus Obscuribacterales bacterium]
MLKPGDNKQSVSPLAAESQNSPNLRLVEETGEDGSNNRMDVRLLDEARKAEARSELPTASDSRVPIVADSEDASSAASRVQPSQDTARVPSSQDTAVNISIAGPYAVPRFGAPQCDAPQSWCAKDWLKLAACSVLAGIFAIGACHFVDVSFDMGYRIVERLFGQAHESNQGWTAIYAQYLVFLPACAAWFMGCCRTFHGRTRKWAVALAIIIAGWIVFVCQNVSSGGSASAAYISMAPLISLSAILGFRSALRFCQAIRGRVLPSRLLLPGIVTLCLGSLYLVLPPESLPYNVSWALHALLLACCAFAVTRIMRIRDTVTGLIAGVFTTMPLLMVNALNVFGNLLSLGLDNFGFGLDLGWRALLSASIIATIYLLSLACGAAIAVLLDRKS